MKYQQICILVLPATKFVKKLFFVFHYFEGQTRTLDVLQVELLIESPMVGSKLTETITNLQKIMEKMHYMEVLR